MLAHAVPLVAPLILGLAALACLRSGGLRPLGALRAAEAATLAALAVAALAAGLLIGAGPGTAGLPGPAGLGLSLRLDALSATMLALVAFVGWAVVRYARHYLDGHPRQGAFTGWLLLTLAAVLLLVLAGDLLLLVLAWVGTSLALRRLLLFYPDRIPAERAARKKTLSARLGDGLLVVAAGLLWSAAGTSDIAAILAAAQGGTLGGGAVQAAALGLAGAALLKSAQFPLHGWLTEVMETPTPVSALLHAGVVNAGGFLLLRFADAMLLSPGALALLVMVGGFTAIFGALVMTTQPAVKTSLAWSTVAQMGFMILQCGLALWPLALLHIVTHSLYKAHAFLAAGQAVETVAAIRRPGPVAIPDARAVGRAFLLALAIYAVVGFAFGLAGKPPQAIAIGAILVFGTAYMIAQGLADAAPAALTRATGLMSLAAAVAYFALHALAGWAMAGTLPATPPPGALEWALMVLAVLSFGLVAWAQATFPLWSGHPAAQGLRVHLQNGLYANALLDRWMGNWSSRRAA